MKARRANLSAGQAARRAARLGRTATTPRAASCTRRSTRCWRTPPPRASAASAASSSRSASPTGGSTSQRVDAVRKHLGDDVPLMVDANQQWDRPTAQRDVPDLRGVRPDLDRGAARRLRPRGPRRAGPAASTPRSPPARCCTSVAEHGELIAVGAADYVQPDAPRVGGITPFLKIAAQAEQAGLDARTALRDGDPLHLAAAYPIEPWVEHFDWLEPAVQRAPGDPRRPHAGVRPPRPRLHPERAGARLDRGTAEFGKRP